MRGQFIPSEGLYPRRDTLDPWVKELAFAILLQAIRDTRSREQSRQAAVWREDAFRWFTAQKDSAGSFVWVCDVLGIDPGKTRAIIWKQNGFVPGDEPRSA